MSDDFTPLSFPRVEACDYIPARGLEAVMADAHIARVVEAWAEEAA